MTETLSIEIDPLLLARVRRVAAAHGWSQQQVLTHLIEHGLFSCEAELAARFNDSDAQALQEAIAALEQIQDDPGFALIGRSAAPDESEGGNADAQPREQLPG